jgi:hypothetical protein
MAVFFRMLLALLHVNTGLGIDPQGGSYCVADDRGGTMDPNG